MTPRRALLPMFAAVALLSCGGAEKEPAAGKPRPQEPAAREDTVDAVAERIMEEVPGCTPDESQPVSPGWKRDGMVSIRGGICEDAVLTGVTVLEFRDAKTAEGLRKEYSLIDDPRADNGPLVASGNIVCHEETKRRRDSVSCMLVVKRYILLALGKRGSQTDDVVDERMPALARAAE